MVICDHHSAGGGGDLFHGQEQGLQFRFLKDALRIMAGRDRNTHKSALAHPKKIGSFKAFSVSLASRVGTGNLAGRDFRIVIVRPGTACGLDNGSSDISVHYNGSIVTIPLPPTRG